MLNFKTLRVFKGLNSSLAQSDAELWLANFGLRGLIIPYVKRFYFWQNRFFEP